MSISKFHKPLLISLVLLSTLPFFFLLSNVDFGLFSTDSASFWMRFSASLGNILGFIGAILMVWELLLGVRFLASLWTDDVSWLNKFHGWIGKYGMLLVFVHPLLETYVYMESWLWLVNPVWKNTLETQVTFGRFAFILLLIVYITSAIARGKIKYRPWLYVHYLSYPILFFTFLHALQIGTYLNQYIALKALWFTLTALYFVVLVWRLWMWSGIGKAKYQILSHKTQGYDILLLGLKPVGRKIVPKVGQYFYLQMRSFGESHPFSIMEFDSKSGVLFFGIKTLGPFTKKLLDLKPNDIISIDGPYGVFTKEGQNELPKVIIAGGIGVTPFVELVKRYKSGSTVFINANRTLGDVVAREKLKAELGGNYIDFLSDEAINDEQIINSQINAHELSSVLGITNLNNYNYFVCGSPGFIGAMKKMLRDLNVRKAQVYTEEFAM